jgi:hypothetical protein
MGLGTGRIGDIEHLLEQYSRISLFNEDRLFHIKHIQNKDFTARCYKTQIFFGAADHLASRDTGGRN